MLSVAFKVIKLDIFFINLKKQCFCRLLLNIGDKVW